MKCQVCKGEKRVSRPTYRYKDYMPPTMACPACSGSGEQENDWEWRRSRLIAYRAAHKLTNKALAEHLGIAEHELSAMLVGYKEPPELP
ncbi:hypothetical protein AYO40_01135 [Planctomycetaceae bacterium SCGC AG-212-D15]|nr:hypothetical protein AYO40_01135 [Planctomycetaceae bacterium SCGC AG-212-D15]